MSSAVKLALERLRMFSPSMPKYIASAPEARAAASDSRLPTGAMISKSDLFITAKLVIIRQTAAILRPKTYTNPNNLIENLIIEGKKLIDIIDEIEYIEPM